MDSSTTPNGTDAHADAANQDWLDRLSEMVDHHSAQDLSADERRTLDEARAHPSPAVRAGAFLAMAHMDVVDPEDVTAVLAALGSEANAGVRSAGISFLVNAGIAYQEEAEWADEEGEEADYDHDAPEPYAALRAYLMATAGSADGDPIVRGHAAEALGDLQDDPVACQAQRAYLGAALPELREGALLGMRAPGDEDGVEDQVLALLGDESPAVRRAAMIAAGRTSLEAALPQIRACLDSPDVLLRGGALIGLAGTAPSDEAYAVIEHAAQTTGEEDPLGPDLHGAMALFNNRWEESLQGGRRASPAEDGTSEDVQIPESEPAIHEWLEAVRESAIEDEEDPRFYAMPRLLDHPSAAVRKDALETIAGLPPVLGLATEVLEYAGAETDVELRAAALGALAELGMGLQIDAEAIAEADRGTVDYEADAADEYRDVREGLIRLAAGEGEPEVIRAAAIVALGDLQDDPIVFAAFTPYLQSAGVPLRLAALRAIGFRKGNPEAGPLVLPLFDDPDLDVRRAAIVAAGHAEIDAALPRIAELLQSPDPLLRGAAWAGYVGIVPVEEAEVFLDEVRPQTDAEWADFHVAQELLRDRIEEIEWAEEVAEEDEPAPAPAPQQPYVRPTPKVGRNDPCPCGSGKKYKKCCGK